MHLALLITCVGTLIVFVICAGLCFAPHGKGTAGCHLVKLTGPVSVGLEIGVVWAVAPPHPVLASLGLGLFGIGLVLFLWALAAHRGRRLTRVYCADAPARLVTTGPYGLVRHPCYTAYLLAFTAGLVGTASPWLLPVVIGNGLLYGHAALTEERKFAHSALADDYAQYVSRTGMFFPNLLKILAKKHRPKFW